jgi:outer membrane protein
MSFFIKRCTAPVYAFAAAGVFALALPLHAQALTGAAGDRAFAPAGCPADPPSQPLGLQQAITRALCNDPRTQQSHAQWQARAAQLELERAQAWPAITATANAGSARQRLRESGSVTVSKAGVGNAALELSWLLLDFGQSQANTQAARWNTLAAAASHDDAALEVAAAAAAAFFALAEAEGVMQVLTQEARFTDELLAQGAQRVASAGPGKSKAPARSTSGPKLRPPAAPGAASARARPRLGEAESTAPAPTTEQALDTELERLQLRADQSRAALERRLARGNLVQARGNLTALLGLPLHTELYVQADDGGADPAWTESAVEPLLQEVLRDHPALRAARARLGAADAGLESAQRSAAPRVLLQHAQRAARDVLRSDSRERVTSLQLDVPLFAGFARKHRESQAQAEVAGARAELRGVEQQVALQTWSAFQSLQTHAVALRQAKTYEDDAKALLAGELASYRLGNSDLHDVLDAHTTVSEASLARISSLTSLRLARMRLAAALGRLHHAAPGVPGSLR